MDKRKRYPPEVRVRAFSFFERLASFADRRILARR
jgi:hypothetical protein